MAPGIVGYADDGVKGYGRMVMVLHGGGWVSLYGHLNKYKTKPGRWVKRGQVIGLSGNTGISKGPHLHFAVIDNGEPIDPIPFLRGMPEHRAPRIAWLGLPDFLSNRI
jgi:murein DD-endopeptidase MepM/ murein hydrolase activator NlpD